MSKSIKKNPSVKAHLGKNGFDLSRDRAFTCPAGMLLPIFKDYAVAGDEYRLNSRHFVRTEALQTAAFMQLKCHTDWFFVPMKLMFSLWNEFYYSTQNVNSSIYDLQEIEEGSIAALPYGNIAYLLSSSKVQEGEQNIGFFGRMGNGEVYNPNIDPFGIPYLWNCRRLCDMLGYGTPSTYYGDPADSLDIVPFSFLAYHACFYSHYNNSMWFKHDPSLFNVDKYYKSHNIQPEELARICSTIHYRPWRKDYFTNFFPNPTFNAYFANSVQSELTSPFSNLRGYINPENLEIGDENAYQTLFNMTIAKGDGALLSSPFLSASDSQIKYLTPADIRAAFSLDKLLRITAMSGSHYDQQTLAHLGFKVPQGIRDEAYFLGSQSFDIQIGEVVATSTTDATGAGATIGDIAGKAFGSSADTEDIHFTCPSEGIIMAIFSVEPIAMYASRGMEVQNRYRNSLDFFHPELDNVGMQPFYATSMGVYNGVSNSSLINGWTYRWIELKDNWDVVNEGFWNTDKHSWVGYKQNVVSDNVKSIPLENLFYISPQYTNSIFLASVPFFRDGMSSPDEETSKYNFKVFGSSFFTWNVPILSAQSVYETDNFMINSNIKCYKSSVMSTYSLPKFL